MVERLLVRLGTMPVGELELLANDNTRFTLSPSYLAEPVRPVLGQTFEDDQKPRKGTESRVPAYFSNLLPEGVLRSVLFARGSIPYKHEFHLLHRLGDDLPGALRLEPLEGPSGSETEEDGPEPGTSSQEVDDALRFSLAGMQLKFSILQQDERWTLPAKGLGGRWIAKLPSANTEYQGIPENEFFTMTWAHRAGIDVPDVRLLDVTEIEGLEPWGQHRSGQAFLVRRFDRQEQSGEVRRVHQEDFAQILDVYGADDGKYQHATFDKLAMLVQRICPDDREEFLRRLVFMVLSGNADMHLKNWSVYYPDQINARLTPAYDQLATLLYRGTARQMAFKLGRSKLFEDVLTTSFERLDRKLEMSASEITRVVSTSVERALEAWRAIQQEMALPQDYQRWMQQRLEQLPLVRN